RRAGSASEGRLSAVGGIVSGALCLGLVMVLTWPALLSSRVSHNEATVVGDIRAITEAEVEYSKANGENYDTLHCLPAPSRCIPGYSAQKSAFLDAALATAQVKAGYRRTFHPGPAPAGGRRKDVSPTSMTTWTYVAVPESPGSSGVRSFCGDGSGRICCLR